MSRPYLVVLVPHFHPDTAPTGEVISALVEQFAAADHDVHVVTALPWYRTHSVEPGWKGLVRRERTPWGSIVRVHPFPGKDKSNLARRAVGFALFSALAGLCTVVVGGWRRRPLAVIAMSPPLTMGLAGWLAARIRRTRLVFNIQDVFPDAAIATGAITNRRLIAVARWLERVSYARSDAVVVLSEDLRDNVVAKLAPRHRAKVEVIPNFVDTARIVPMARSTRYRDELGAGDGPVVMYAGNVGFSQSLGLMVAAARAIPGATFVVNGDGSARASLEESARGVGNIVFNGYQPRERVAEVLASADVHVVVLKTGLGAVSVPSKTYSILAAARPVVASIDAGTEVTRILADSGAGVSVPPDDESAFISALRTMIADPDAGAAMGLSGRKWVEDHVSVEAVAHSYLELCRRLAK